MTVNYDQLVTDGVLAPIHRGFVDMLRRAEPTSGPLSVLAAALASEQLARGHVCLDLARVSELSFAGDGDAARTTTYTGWPTSRQWSKELKASGFIDARSAADEARNIRRPVIWDEERQRVYLARYWFYQQRLATMITARLDAEPVPLQQARLKADLAQLFANPESDAERDQYRAVANAVSRRLAIVCGGPGTGKTTTVAKLLALRMMQADADSPLRILLMAPTGKAAQRLNESLRRATDKLIVPEAVKQQLQQISAGTIHRSLGWTPLPPESGGPFRHREDCPLDADVVLVDEASMVDLGLMWHLFSALRPETQVILMGDRDQLASVEAGGVLSDLAGDAEVPATSKSRPKSRSLFDVGSPLSQAISTLKFSHRFAATSDLGRLAAAVRAGQDDEFIDLLKNSQTDRVCWLSHPEATTRSQAVIDRASQLYRDYLERISAGQGDRLAILQSLARTRVLCAHREGPAGEHALNQQLAARLSSLGLLHPRSGHYVGQAVMVTENDYQRGLFNGDVGVVVGDTDRQGLGVLFEDGAVEEGCRVIPAALAPTTRDCWAMTIHKSQGSEFHHVLVVLPDFDSPVLTRELLYTAITRVRDERDPITQKTIPGLLCLAGTEAVLRATVKRQIQRTSGLRDAIQSMSQR